MNGALLKTAAAAGWLAAAAAAEPLDSESAVRALRPGGRFSPAAGSGGIAVSEDRLASQVGAEILRAGGNAVDAAAAMGFALAVTYPRAGNLGGGGFMIVHDAETGETFALDFRETAPAAAGRDMFLDDKGEPDSQRSLRSPLASGVPGSPAGLLGALEAWGSMPLADVVAPAIRLAEDGFPVTREFSESLRGARDDLTHFPAAGDVFFGDDGEPPAPGELLRQPDLAGTLRAIADRGADGFYRGPTAEKFAAFMAESGGLITADDLAGYEVKVREPVSGTYRGFRIASMPPPSAGGALLVSMLNVLERHDLSALGHGSAAHVHLVAETMKRAYADRAKYFGDPDFVDVPVQRLISAEHADAAAASIDLARATPSKEIGDPSLLPPGPDESPETTHFSVIDRHGNAVACTTTLNLSYGSGIMVPGTGVLLNNEMDDFAAKPGSPNAFGAVGGEANAIAPRKRMLSSMTPVIVFRENGKVWLASGAPGGTRITTAVLQTISGMIDFRMNPAAAIAAPRVHHQWTPDVLYHEDGISPDTLDLLRQMGHRLARRGSLGSVQSAAWDGDDMLYGWSDPRRENGAAVTAEP